MQTKQGVLQKLEKYVYVFQTSKYTCDVVISILLIFIWKLLVYI